MTILRDLNKYYRTDNATAVAADIALDKTAYVSGGKVVGVALSNVMPYSRDLTGWLQLGTPVLSFDQTGIDGSANAATLVNDNYVSGNEYIRFAYSGLRSDTTVSAASFYVKKDSDNTIFPEFHLRSNTSDALAGDGLALQINTSTGASAARIDTGTNGNWTVASYDANWWKVTMDAPNTSDKYIILAVVPAASNSLGGAWVISLQRSVVMGNIEMYFNATEADIPADPNYNL